MNIDKLSAEELVALQSQINQRLVETRAERLAALRADIEQRIAQAGFSLGEVLPTGRSSRSGVRANGPVVAKYSDGKGRTWAGKGKRPVWFSEHLRNGGKAEDLLIK